MKTYSAKIQGVSGTNSQIRAFVIKICAISGIGISETIRNVPKRLINVSYIGATRPSRRYCYKMFHFTEKEVG